MCLTEVKNSSAGFKADMIFRAVVEAYDSKRIIGGSVKLAANGTLRFVKGGRKIRRRIYQEPVVNKLCVEFCLLTACNDLEMFDWEDQDDADIIVENVLRESSWLRKDVDDILLHKVTDQSDITVLDNLT